MLRKLPPRKLNPTSHGTRYNNQGEILYEQH